MQDSTLVIVALISLVIGAMIPLICKRVIDSSKKHEIQMQLQENNMHVEHDVEYTKGILDFIKSFVSDNAVLRTRAFFDSKEIDKVTRVQVEELAREVAEDVHQYMKQNKIQWELMLVDTPYIDHYIIDLSLHSVKRLVEQTLNNE